MLENMPRTLEWVPGSDGQPDTLRLVDQRRLPRALAFVECTKAQQVCDAIADLVVRGAPAIGCAGAYALALWARNEWRRQALRARIPTSDATLFMTMLESRAKGIATVRPTAVNLSWAVTRCIDAVRAILLKPDAATQAAGLEGGMVTVAQDILLAEARAIEAEDEENCRLIGVHGAAELEHMGAHMGRPLNVETHCNAGSLATAFYGTALSVVYHAHKQGDIEQVWVDETRPVGQGARLTAWELGRAGVPYTLICDNMAGSIMRAGKVDAVIVGADRICANGDFANKIGTYPLAVLAAQHEVPFFVAAPSSSFDKKLASGEDIVIEQRDAEEVRAGVDAPEGCNVYNPAFDVTPNSLVTGGFITEEGIARPKKKRRWL